LVSKGLKIISEKKKKKEEEERGSQGKKGKHGTQKTRGSDIFHGASLKKTMPAIKTK